jgi:type IV pilus assembly protein PilP
MYIEKYLFTKTVFYCVLMLAAGGCARDDTGDLQAYVAGVQVKQYAGIDPLPTILASAVYNYDVKDSRDPFKQIPNKTIEVRECTEITHKRDALEAFPLDTLSMVGSVERDSERWALIRTRDGIVHRRRVNDYMGEDNGQIMKITENSIELLESISQGGGCVKKTTILTLNQ